MLTKKWVLFPVLILLTIVSCSKPDDVTPAKPDPEPETVNPLEKLADSIYNFTNEVWYWNTKMPNYGAFNPRQYIGKDEVVTANNIMEALNKYEAKDIFSYATTYEQGNLNQSGEDIDFGMLIQPAFTNSGTQIEWFVAYAYAQSDAGLAGVKRGWTVSEFDGLNMKAVNQAQFDAQVDKFNEIYNGSSPGKSVVVKFLKPNGTSQTTTITLKKFNANPILFSNVREYNGKKVGYLVFNRFYSGLSSRTEIEQAITDLQNQNINELILDLRYNGGGATLTQDKLTNLIAPVSVGNNKNTMYAYDYNDQLEEGDSKKYPWLNGKFGFPNDYFKDNVVNFEKTNTLNLSRVFIITTGNTASASELLINNLKGIDGFAVHQIGSTTYGKPVGFFGIDFMDKVTIYPVSFRTLNAKGITDYYDGITPEKEVGDGLTKNWGDEAEDCYAAAISFITDGNYPVTTSTVARRAIPKFKNMDVKKLQKNNKRNNMIKN
ncbi:S41 family peptidase [Niabella ginsengisoli]|uniref:S41 family peptidase n=1 Tax=Niabella ginsengisoli TaxID=522298 RepID=A0ABS9SH59_9BACT|nr:S41 family peptidase [Niabella ginsengisoli]MCH5597706.1 S41 family peptidase [Niabella ginsengisoli]